MTTSSGKHAEPGPASDQPPVPEPTFAERARTLVYLGRVGSLSTLAEIIQHMNCDHRDALVFLARKFARIEATEATMTAVDRLGFHVRLKTPDGMRGARIAFLREVSNPAETRKVLVEMAQKARSQAE
jgi:Protein of unknown function (DUF2470)